MTDSAPSTSQEGEESEAGPGVLACCGGQACDEASFSGDQSSMGSGPVLEGACCGSQSSIGSRSGSISERRSIESPGREAGEGGLGLKYPLWASFDWELGSSQHVACGPETCSWRLE